MRSSVIWIAAACFALVATAGQAADVEEQLLQMQQKLNQLESRLDATTDELEAANERVEQQQELIQSSGLADPRGADSSGLASFLESVEMGGWVAASYLYNFNDPDGGALGGANTTTGGFAYPFHPDANSFQLDQLWFELEKTVSEDSRAGFRADLLYGKTAEFLSNSRGGVQLGNSGSENQLELYQAYVQYLAPIGNGVHIKAGKFATVIGAEVAQSPYNFNITRGSAYNLFQPFTHTGIFASMENNGASAGIGLVNSNTSTIDVDNNNFKSVLWTLGYGQDTWSASFNGVYGANDVNNPPGASGSNERDKDMILNLLVSWDPTEQFSGYIDATYRETENVFGRFGGPACPTSGTGLDTNCADAEGWGISAAGRYALNDRTGLSLRLEYIEDSDSFYSGTATSTAGEETELFSVTGTVDYALTEQLMLRGEVRYDTADVDTAPTGAPPNSDDIFFADGTNQDDQFVGALELIYSF